MLKLYLKIIKCRSFSKMRQLPMGQTKRTPKRGYPRESMIHELSPNSSLKFNKRASRLLNFSGTKPCLAASTKVQTSRCLTYTGTTTINISSQHNMVQGLSQREAPLRHLCNTLVEMHVQFCKLRAIHANSKHTYL